MSTFNESVRSFDWLVFQIFVSVAKRPKTQEHLCSRGGTGRVAILADARLTIGSTGDGNEIVADQADNEPVRTGTENDL